MAACTTCGASCSGICEGGCAVMIYNNKIVSSSFVEGSSGVSLGPDFINVGEIIEYSLPNIVVNGGFEDSTGWSNVTYDTSQHLFGSKSSKLAGNAGTVLNTRPAILPIVNHVYYGRHSIKTDGNSTPADCRFEWFAGDGEGLNFVFGWNNGNHSNWYTESTLLKVTSVKGSSYVIRNFVVNATANCWCDGLMIVDLTAFFGTGKEPGKEWCDSHLVFTDNDIIVSDGGVSISPSTLYAPEFQEI